MGPAKGKEATTRNPGKYQGFSVGGLILHFEIVILFFFFFRQEQSLLWKKKWGK